MLRALRFVFLFALALPGTQVLAQHSTQPLELTYALVEVTHGNTPSVSIAIQQGLPPGGGATHMFGVPTVNVLRYDNTNSQFVKNAGTLHHFRYYVLGIPQQLRVSDLEAGTVTTIRLGDPPLVLLGQNGNCGILFPDAHFIGCQGNVDRGWLISATVGEYRKHMSWGISSANSGAHRMEYSIGLMPQGQVYYGPGSDPNFRGHQSLTAWMSPTLGPQTATLYVSYDYGSSGTQISGGPVAQVLLRYVIGY